MKSRIYLSLAAGAFFGISVFFVLRKLTCAVFYALLSGAGFGFLLFLFLAFHHGLTLKRYARIESEISSPIFFKSNGNFDLGGGSIRNGNLYFCEAGIVCVSLEGKTFSLYEILVQDISHIAYDTIRLYIHIKDGRQFRITLPDAAQVIELLIERDWVE